VFHATILGERCKNSWNNVLRPKNREGFTLGDLAPMTSKAKSVLLKLSGYLIPLVQSIPTLGAYAGLMTLPVISYLVLLFAGFPVSIVDALKGLLLMSFVSFGALFSVLGFLFALSSVVYLRVHGRDGLVKTGPYRYVRHPQYAGILLMTVGLTGWSYWYLTNTFGVGWLTPQGTIGLWYAELCAYLVLALVEESYLTREFGDEYVQYKRDVPFLVPFVRARRYDIPVSIFVLSLVLLVSTEGLLGTFHL